MCGIFAISGSSQNSGEQVLKGLKTLEYRGYDSWGVAVRTIDNGPVHTTKDIGKISNVDQTFPEGIEAVGHTRWATHGGVTTENAHPHQIGSVTVVHNGIFENYTEHKKRFLAAGKIFTSETDTEVIGFLIEEFLQQGCAPDEALRRTAQEIQGRFSLLIMFDNFPGIYAARRGSPLIIGRSKTETFIASDIPAFLEKTRTVNYLDDNELVLIKGGEAHFSNLKTGKPITKRNIIVPWKLEEAEKGEFSHFMIKEIFDQKDTITRAINHENKTLNKVVKILQDSNGTYLVACGTAHKVAAAAEYFFTEISGRKVNVVPASEMAYFERFINERTALMAISQSGETADILEVFEAAQRKKAKLLSMTNVESSSVARMSSVHLPINAGPEKAVASTKATTAQMALLFLLAHADAGSINTGREILRATAASINDLLNPRYEELVRDIAKDIVDVPNLFVIGRGALYPMALEAAIKIQEVSYIHAQGFAAGELKHGPIALIEKDLPCIVLGDDPETISNAIELKSRGAKIIGVSPKKMDVFDHWLKVPDCDGAQAIASIIPVQILAYHLAVLRGLDPDMPRNLAKSVTVK
jgi:glucosamine--fructose-6-phosphate aminotransferase (isomerizing)